MTTAAATPARELQGLTADVERRILLFLAARVPARIGPDHLTAVGFAGMLLAGAGYALSARTPALLLAVNAALALNWLGDSLDGTLARYRNRQRPRYGFYVDHIVDAFGTAFLVGGLALSGYMNPVIALGLLVAYLMLSAEVYLATYSLGTFKISYFKVGPTELRIILAIGTLMLHARPTIVFFGHPARLFDVGGVFAIAGMLGTLVTSAISNTRKLYRAEPIPPREVRE